MFRSGPRQILKFVKKGGIVLPAAGPWAGFPTKYSNLRNITYSAGSDLTSASIGHPILANNVIFDASAQYLGSSNWFVGIRANTIVFSSGSGVDNVAAIDVSGQNGADASDDGSVGFGGAGGSGGSGGGGGGGSANFFTANGGLPGGGGNGFSGDSAGGGIGGAGGFGFANQYIVGRSNTFTLPSGGNSANDESGGPGYGGAAAGGGAGGDVLTAGGGGAGGGGLILLEAWSISSNAPITPVSLNSNNGNGGNGDGGDGGGLSGGGVIIVIAGAYDGSLSPQIGFSIVVGQAFLYKLNLNGTLTDKSADWSQTWSLS